MKFTRVMNNKYLFATLAIGVCVAYSMIVTAAPLTNPYNPGETLNPTCAPGALNCSVVVPWLTDSVNGYVYNTTHKIGIGTATPTAALDIEGDFTQMFSHAGGTVLSAIGSGANLLGLGLTGNALVTLDSNNNYLTGFASGDFNDGDGNVAQMMLFDLTGTKSISAKTLWNTGAPIFEVLGADSNSGNFGIMDVGSGSVAFQAFHPGKYRSFFSTSATATGLYSNFANVSVVDGFQTALQSKFDDGNPSARGIGLSTTHNNTDPHSASNSISVDDTGIKLLMTPDVLGTFSSGITINNDASGISVMGNDNLGSSTNMRWASSTADLMYLMNDGRLTLGLAGSSSDLLTVGGDVRVGTSATNGCLKDFSGGTIIGTCSSDERLKTNIEPVTNILDGFSKLNVVTYQWNDVAQAKGFHGGVEQMGVLAQNVRDVFPDLVTTDSTGYYQVNYARLPLLTIEAVKELNVKLDALQDFASTIDGSFVSRLKNWLGNSANGLMVLITDSLQAGDVHVARQLCVGTVCVSQEQFLRMAQMAGSDQSGSIPVSNGGNATGSSSGSSVTTTSSADVTATSVTSSTETVVVPVTDSSNTPTVTVSDPVPVTLTVSVTDTVAPSSDSSSTQ